MDLGKIEEKIESAEVVEELIMLSKKVFEKSSEDAQNIIEKFIIKSYWMGKKNMVKSFDE